MDLILRNGTVVDGTGAPRRSADVGVADGRIVAVGEVPATHGAEEVDLGGAVLAPGFVDIHTHYDAQILWDPDLTPSCWHGVTSVVMGNCGFGIAPTRPEHRETIARTLENVEGMAFDALVAGIDWTFETFPEYLAAVDGLPKRLNVGVLAGHTPTRLYVLGDEASDREASEDEVAQMATIIREALEAGAVGFSTSGAPTHAGAYGKPVPSRLATFDEIRTLATQMGEVGRGVMQATVGANLFLDQFAEISTSTGRPVSWTALLSGMWGQGGAAGIVEATAQRGGQVWPQVACRPLVMQVTLADPFPMATMASFQEVLAVPHDRRADVYRDPEWRARMHADHGIWGDRLTKATIQETGRHTALVDGPTMADLAAERGVDPFDLMIDLALEDDLQTRFRIVLANDDEEELAGLLQDERTVLGLSDAGAHASQLCDANFSTHLLEDWVRNRGVLTLEQAVWRLSGQAAEVFRLEGRGRIEEGAAADLVVFDPDEVGSEPLERVWDLPAGADRLIARSRGIEHVWVNGTAIRRDGEDLDARPGVLLRGAP
ncbi:MAG TPA: amidohydrolase family protein [Acidimicrobiales bacterium]|nr:amidohydrolase family protein [Acidimicrobiales bacterium]